MSPSSSGDGVGLEEETIEGYGVGEVGWNVGLEVDFRTLDLGEREGVSVESKEGAYGEALGEVVSSGEGAYGDPVGGDVLCKCLCP